MIHCILPTFVTWVQQKAGLEAPGAYVLIFHQGYYSREKERNKKGEAAEGEQI